MAAFQTVSNVPGRRAFIFSLSSGISSLVTPSLSNSSRVFSIPRRLSSSSEVAPRAMSAIYLSASGPYGIKASDSRAPEVYSLSTIVSFATRCAESVRALCCSGVRSAKSASGSIPSCLRIKGSLLALSNSSPPTWKDPTALPTAIATAPTAQGLPPVASAVTPAAPRAIPAAPRDGSADLPNCCGVCVSSGRIFSYRAPQKPPSFISSSRVWGASYALRSSSCCSTISVPISSRKPAPPSQPKSERTSAPGPAIAEPKDF